MFLLSKSLNTVKKIQIKLNIRNACRKCICFSHHLQHELIVLCPHCYGWSYCHAAFYACVPRVTQTCLFSHDDGDDGVISFLLICWYHCDSWLHYVAVFPGPHQFAALDALHHSIRHQQPFHRHHPDHRLAS